MHDVSHHDRVWSVEVWGRFGKTKNRVVIANVYRRTRMEAVAFLIGLGYELVGR